MPYYTCLVSRGQDAESQHCVEGLLCAAFTENSVHETHLMHDSLMLFAVTQLIVSKVPLTFNRSLVIS